MKCFAPGGKQPLLGGTTSTNFNGANATVTLATARTTMPTANCFRGLKVGVGETVTLTPGTYYIGEAGADIQGTLNATGPGVTIVLTRIDTTKAVGTLKMTASGVMNITAPQGATDYYKGIAVFQDRNAVDGVGINNMINGNTASNIIGAVYFPKQELTYNGTGTSGFVCTRLVSRRVIFSGNTSVSNKIAKSADCPGLDYIGGGGRVRLVA